MSHAVDKERSPMVAIISGWCPWAAYSQMRPHFCLLRACAKNPVMDCQIGIAPEMGC